MNTILTPTDVINSGLPISTDIRTEEIQFWIDTIETVYLRDILGPVYQEIIETPADFTNILNGSADTPSLKLGLLHAVYAYGIYEQVSSTRYHAVIKTSDESTVPDPKVLKNLSMHHYEIFLTICRRICEFLNIPTKGVHGCSMIFSELLWCGNNDHLL